ncbi:MAG: hypothetical protein HBSAPP03_28760 [Phycisphaerae bacterium]|nr:MAG: hypothetical protein HBSAPP03_28760 [Phycisphaerae bacterium]
MSDSPHTPRRDTAAMSRRKADALLNRVLDLEAEGAQHEARRLAKLAAAAHDEFPTHAEALRRALGAMSEMPRGRDLSDTILAQVENHRPYLPSRSRRRVSSLRMAGACGALAALTGYVLVQRMAPPTPTEPMGAPVSSLIAAGQADMKATASGVTDAFRSLSAGLFEPVSDLARHGAAWREPSLSLGGTAEYEVSTARATEIAVSGSSVLTIVDVTPYGYAVKRYSPNFRPVLVGEFAELDEAWRTWVPASRLTPARPNHPVAEVYREGTPPNR